MFKLSFHSNGKLEAIEVSWKIILVLAAVIGSFLSGIFATIIKGILILAIAFQGLFADPDSFYRRAQH